MMRFLLRILTGDDQMHMDRWRGFSLYTDTGDQQTGTELWDSMTGTTSNLLALSFYSNGFSAYPTYPDAPSATLGFPRLSAVRSYASNHNIQFDTLSLRPQIVTNLYLGHENTGLSFMRHAASFFTALVKLDLSLGFDDDAPSMKVYVPRLQELRVNVIVYAPFLSYFDAPNLSYLELSGCIGQTLPRSDIFTRIKSLVWSASTSWKTLLLVNLSVTFEQNMTDDDVRREMIDIKAAQGGLSHLKLVKYVWPPVAVDDNQSSEKVSLSLDTDPHDWDEVRIIESSCSRRGDV